uniref:Intradiol ring-cleavage dioxygenases domain-containing protein n=2 Tax=Tetranychus urticae TaxID=32264 RepID=T1KSX3_TETUR
MEKYFSSICLIFLTVLISHQSHYINCDNSNVVTFSPYKNKSPNNASLLEEPVRPKRQSTQKTCSITPMSTEGPYYLKDVLERRDITDGKPGIPLNLTINVMDAMNQCKTLSGLRVDIWHCDALGVYSGVGSIGFASRRFGRGKRQVMTSISPVDRFLRGYQITDAQGQVNFKTIVPGWYPGRPIHIHFEVYSPSGKLVHVGQLYFEEPLSATLDNIEPYSRNPSKRVPNEIDRIYRDTDGFKTVLFLLGKPTEGMTSKCGIGLDLSATVPIQFSGRGFGRG